MDESNLYHFCECQFKLYEIPIRIFKGGVCVKKFEHYNLGIFEKERTMYTQDLLETYREKGVYFNIQGSLLLEGAVFDRNSDLVVYVGFARSVRVTREIARRHFINLRVWDMAEEVFDQLYEYMNTLPIVAPGLFAILLSSVHTFLNGEVKEPREIFQSNMTEQAYPALHAKLLAQREERYFAGGNNMNSVETENQFLLCVENGMVQELKKLVKDVGGFDYAGDAANPDAWRMMKNRCIVGIAVVSRRAIAAGIPSMEGLQLCDLYIQKAELCRDAQGLNDVRYNMLLDFTERVRELKLKKTENDVIRRVADYLMDHTEENISLSELAEHFHMNKNYLCTMFKDEVGMGISEYTNYHKVTLAKQLLRFTNKPLIEIADYLGFCSQSYFQQVFKRITGMTPTAYRNQTEQ